jgi:uncharacterized protein (TIGR02301 family)
MKAATAAALVLLALLVQPAAAQDRAPAARQKLIELAYVLGESHALKQTCQGHSNYYWYTRMKQLLDVEASDQALQARLANNFNTGYAAGKAAFPTCGKDLKAEAAKLALRGQGLAEQLSKP